MSVLEDIYRLLDEKKLAEYELDSDMSIIDPLGVESIAITAQERESCSAGEGSWIQMAQEYGFESNDGSW